MDIYGKMIISHQTWGSLFSGFFESQMRLHPLLQALRKPAPTTSTLRVKPRFLDSHQIRVIPTSPGEGRFARGKNQKGGSIGTAPDRLAGTAVDCVIFFSTSCLMLPLSLDPACS